MTHSVPSRHDRLYLLVKLIVRLDEHGFDVVDMLHDLIDVQLESPDGDTKRLWDALSSAANQHEGAALLEEIKQLCEDLCQPAAYQ